MGNMECEICQDHLTDVLGAGRPQRLLEAIQQGLAAKAGSGAGDRKEETEGSGATMLELECRVCPNTGPAKSARAYLEAPPPKVVLCANRLGSRAEVESAVVHELVHAYDYLVAGVQLLDCQSLAYSEVRAAKAAECSKNARSFACSHFRKKCVRSTAVRSTEGLFPGKGAACVDAVFADAYQDHSPHGDDDKNGDG